MANRTGNPARLMFVTPKALNSTAQGTPVRRDTLGRDGVASSAPRGRDSIAQGTNLPVGAPALGRSADKGAKPQRGEIPLSARRLCGQWNLAPLGLWRYLDSLPR